MATINIGSLYGNATFSDVTIKFGDSELKAHKFVLSSKSTYFAKILEDSTSSTIKLYGDSEAIDCMLRYIYQEVYPSMTEQGRTWEFHLRMAAAGDTFGIPKLLIEGVSKFMSYHIRDCHIGLAMLQTLPHYYYLTHHFPNKARELRHKYLLPALRDPAARRSLLRHPDRASEYIGLMATALVELQSHEAQIWNTFGHDMILQQFVDKMPVDLAQK
ncbi:hypothetical protein LTR97_005079 [Elasticomyces elasticus]|uniref:BTB domain-containing protein n=1 Tax=Elasticomyces elasticus TaxID=574655 RepID=A0AAN8A333_9PEZI|nr:hypothetical protein LTR97_005079 [Elasticomyces elasticus]